MAYQPRPHYAPPEHEPKPQMFMGRPPPHQYGQHYPIVASPTHASMPDPAMFDPESESSDVSDTPGQDYHSKAQSAIPAALPPPPSKHVSESPDTIQARLRELQRVEDFNIKKQELLRAKRARKDDRIRRKREAQDLRIKAIMDARARRDERVSRRRKVEDAAFERFDQDLEEEELNLRRRLKRLKRGLPVDDILNHNRSLSSSSMSPPGPAFSTLPPPPKRHQPGPPGQTNSPSMSHRPTSQGSIAPPSLPPPPQSSTSSRAPSHSFVQAGHPTQPPVSYGRSPTYSQSPIVSTASPYPPYARMGGPPADLPPYGANGQPSSPHASRPSVVPPTVSTPTSAPPRHVSSTYDTRPPPPATSNFASINAPPPPPSGFAAINSRTIGTPPNPPIPTLKESNSSSFSRSDEPDRGSTQPRPYVSEGTPTGGSGNSGTIGKRTPSTTHPYQMSEAFANRHHHCERTDRLNRGIWTYYGAGGSKENPTAPAQEMYLRCNHDDCKRIDWRTVHGLQCHIVKNHEQPKGTIGSLEKALDRYGVPLVEIESYEREHGEGTAGTMADPKMIKTKAKTKDTPEKADTPMKSDTAPQAQDVYRANLAMTLGGNAPPTNTVPSPMNNMSQSIHADAVPTTGVPALTSKNAAPQPPSRFAAVNGIWGATIPSKAAELKDTEMKDAPPPRPVSPQGLTKPSQRKDKDFWRMWDDSPESKPQIRPIPLPKQQSVSTIDQSPSLPPSSNVRPIVQDPMVAPTPVAQPSMPTTTDNDATKSVSLPQKEDQDSIPGAEKVKDNIDNTTESRGETSITNAITAEPVQMPNIPARTPQVEPPTKASTIQPSAAQPKESKESKEDQPKETEKEAEVQTSKVDGEDSKRTTIQTPAITTRRGSIVTARRGSSRRASLAASKAEKEKEKEKEEEKRREKERERELELNQAPPAASTQQQAQPGKQTQSEPDEEGTERQDQTHEEQIEDEDEEADGDTIIVNPISRDKDKKERERRRLEEEETGKTPPKRLANGRFVRKATR